ncbi:MAG: flagellar brake domain-containing protein [Lachnospiraceae bacterium]|nr:flagellar brake domain-containing protein [Lachnospiraceae bacterium]
MTIEDIGLGCKVEIRILQEAIRAKQTGEEVNTYISSIYDILEDGTFELDMPSRAGKVILLPMNVRYELIFISGKGMWMAQAQINERYKKGSFYLLRAELIGQIEKFQRREYFRLDCMITAKFLSLDLDEQTILRIPDISKLLAVNEELRNSMGLGTIMDLSGGGARLTANKDVGEIPYMLLQFELEGRNRTNIELFARILEKRKALGTDLYTYRLKFLFRDKSWQEYIIKYIFEEQRKLRRQQ